eukprot:7479442-Pyramimonas_sp.AAC.1
MVLVSDSNICVALAKLTPGEVISPKGPNSSGSASQKLHSPFTLCRAVRAATLTSSHQSNEFQEFT